MLLTLVAGIPTLIGFALVVAGHAVRDALGRVYVRESFVGVVWTILRLPLRDLLDACGHPGAASGVALFLGLACCVQLEAYHAGGTEPCGGTREAEG